MLNEIYCDKFIQPIIKFDKGLNVILGSNSGDNSIGKSTMLLIIDYVFGGSTYSSLNDIKRYIQNHDIFFKFTFDDGSYWFCRTFEDKDNVWKCDEDYNKIKLISLKEYTDFLIEKYDLIIPDSTFRDTVSLYSRIYGKDNYNEHNPLQISKEGASSSILRLIKLFNLYTEVKENELDYKEKNETVDIYKKSQTKNLIPKISKKEYEKNQKEILVLEEQLRSLELEVDNSLSDVDSITSENVIRIKRELTAIKRLKNSVLIKLAPLDENLNYKFSISSKDILELQKYFPNINMKKIEDVEHFHNKINKIFSKEIKEEIKYLEDLLIEYDEIISEYEKQIVDLIGNKNLSKGILLKHSQLLNTINKMKKENEIYEQLDIAEKNKKDSKEKLEIVKENKLTFISQRLNNMIKILNKKIIGADVNIPTLEFTKTNYSYITPNDSGTGTAYKGLIVFDLSILNLTQLPFIIHDSILFKQVSDSSLEKILELYESSSKQIFIALDKPKSYTKRTSELLYSKKSIELSRGKELFGMSWGLKSS